MRARTLPGLTLLHSVVPLPGLALPVASPLVTVGDARILISPGSRLDEAQLQAAGPLTDLVAPNLLHAAGMARAAALFPSARLWGPPGIAKKFPQLRWSGTLGQTPWPYEEALALHVLDGMPAVRECVFVHRASHSLLVTDLAFNLIDASGVGARLLLGLFGTYRRFAVSRLFLLAVKDRQACVRSLAPLFATEYTHVVPSHGAPLFDEGKERLRAALAERGLAV